MFSLQQRYSQNPLALLRIIRHCLGTELKLVQQAENVIEYFLIKILKEVLST